ncbi:MAG: hypothetical protein OEO23_07985 [Gemmatimonadota bacterium]|nr:hypothetical protein [Gemmatimonadota bacterium]
MSQGESDLPRGVRSSKDPAVQDDSRVLRAKYRDYCSARVADVLLSLSPDEIYIIAEAEARKLNEGQTPDSYTEAVEFATRRVRHQLNLPDFSAWADAYRTEPGRFDPLLLGLWETEEECASRREDAAS